VLEGVAIGTAEFGDVQVDVRCEATVQLELALARAMASLLRAKVQEPEINGLLDLVRTITYQDDHAAVGFA
jgi:hypothetical protein